MDHHYTFENDYLQLFVHETDKTTLEITGTVHHPERYTRVMAIFAANPIDRMMSYTGSGLPFPNEEIAFEGSRNVYQIPKTGVVNTRFKKPNAYYTHTKVAPCLFVRLDDTTIRFQLNEPKPPARPIGYR
jgi:hypothetical protein